MSRRLTMQQPHSANRKIARGPKRSVRLVGAHVRDARHAAGITQEELAAQARLSVGSVRLAESGRKIAYETARDICIELNLIVDDQILKDDGDTSHAKGESGGVARAEKLRMLLHLRQELSKISDDRDRASRRLADAINSTTPADDEIRQAITEYAEYAGIFGTAFDQYKYWFSKDNRNNIEAAFSEIVRNTGHPQVLRMTESALTLLVSSMMAEIEAASDS